MNKMTSFLLKAICVVIILLCVGYIALDNYNLYIANKQLKEDLQDVRKQLEDCKDKKADLAIERDNARMALDETYELFLTCQRTYESGE